MSSQPHAVTDRQCPGCQLFFSPSGLSKHLAQTHKPACVAVRDGDNGPVPALPTQSHPDIPQSSPFDDVDMDAPPVDFEGDFFSNYDPGFFDEDEQVDSPAGVEPPPESDDDDNDDAFPELDRWEPEPRRPSSSAGDPPVESDSEPLPGGDSELRENAASPQGLSQSSREAIEANTSTRKTFVVRFPSHRAGAAMPSVGESDVHTGLGANKTYHAQLQPTDADNPYHPFANRLDWQVARWAKMCGPGSTAFSELLSIEEVRLVATDPYT